MTVYRKNDAFLTYARRRLNAWARKRSDGYLEREWTYLLADVRVVRATLKTPGGMVFDIAEVSEGASAGTLYRWAREYAKEDDLEARRLSGFDPRRVSEGLSDEVVEIEEDLREIRVRADGMVAAAAERGEDLDRELSAELADAIALAVDVAARLTEPPHGR